MGGRPDGRIPATEVYAVHMDSCTRVTTDFRQALAQPSLGPLGADLAFPDPFRSGATCWSPPTLPHVSPIPNLASSQPAVCGINPGTCFFWHWALSPLQTKTLGCQNYCFNHEFLKLHLESQNLIIDCLFVTHSCYQNLSFPWGSEYLWLGWGRDTSDTVRPTAVYKVHPLTRPPPHQHACVHTYVYTCVCAHTHNRIIKMATD